MTQCFLATRLAKELLEHESINLPQIMKVLGDRPYPLKESIRDYLEELERRKAEEERNQEIEAAEAAMKSTETSEETADKAETETPAAEKDEEVVDSAKPLEDAATEVKDDKKDDSEGKK